MKPISERFLPVFNTAAGDGGGGAAAEAKPAAAGAAAPEGGTGAASPAATPESAAAADWLAKVPEQFRGKDERETIEKQQTALEGYRTRDAERKVPEDAGDYAKFEFDKLPADIRPQLETLVSDPLFASVSAKAKELGVSVNVMQALTAELYGAGAKAGLFADTIDPAKERSELLPVGFEGKPQAEQEAAITARLKSNEDFVNLLVKNSMGEDGKVKAGGLSKTDADNMMFWLGSDASGNRALEFMRAQMSAGNSGPLLGGQGAGGDTRETLRAEIAKPEMQASHPQFSRAKHDALMARYQNLFKG